MRVLIFVSIFFVSIFSFSFSENNKVVIKEFASYTCSHCKRFNDVIYPKIKSDYLDKYENVVFEYHHFPLDNLAMKIALIEQCVPNSRKINFTKLIYKNQSKIFGAQGDVWLRNAVTYYGIDKEKYNKCLGDNKSYKKILKNKKQYIKDYGIEGTPTLFINGVKVSPFNYEQIKSSIENGLKKN